MVELELLDMDLYLQEDIMVVDQLGDLIAQNQDVAVVVLLIFVLILLLFMLV